MIHYSCDMCGKPIHPEEEFRYVVKIEVYPADESEEENEVFDDDDLAEFNLEDERELEEASEGEENDMEYKTLRFDLCSECHKVYIRDPLFLKGYRSRFFNN